jgi:hypothetical protein
MNKCYVVYKLVNFPGEENFIDIRLFKNKESADKYKEKVEISLREEYQNELEDYGEECIEVFVREQKIED